MYANPVMKNKNSFIIAILVCAVICLQTQIIAQSATNFPAPMTWSANQDHQNMMDQLGIKSVRPGADGMNPKAANYQNTDEARANPYPNLPDPLTLNNGQKV